MPTLSEIYWRNRINQEMEWQQSQSYQHQREVDQIYRDTVDYVIDDINAFFQRYGDREGISRSEVVKTVKQTDLNLLANRVREYVESEDFSPEANAMLKEYNLTGRANRATLLKHKIDLATHQLANAEEKLVSSKLSEEITHQMEVAAGIWEMSVPEVDTLRSMATAIKNKPFKGGVWSERLWDRQEALAGHLSGIVDKIILKGQNATTMINEVRQAFNTSSYVAKRLLVTETARVQSEAQKELMLYNEFEEYRFLAEPTACEHCMALNEKVFKVEDMMPGVNCSPIHPNCRCSSAPEYSEVEDVMSEPPEQPTYNPYDYVPFVDHDASIAERVENIRVVARRNREAAELFKAETGIDILESARNRRFSDESNPYNDEHAQYFEWLLERTGYNGLPQRLTDFDEDEYYKMYRGIRDTPDGLITKEEFVDNFRNGKMDISGANSSAFGRGMYFDIDDSVAKQYASGDGVIFNAYLPKNSNFLIEKDIKFIVPSFAALNKDEIGEDYPYYSFMLSGTVSMDEHYGILALMHGYDGVKQDEFAGQAIHNVINRTKLGVLEDEDN